MVASFVFLLGLASVTGYPSEQIIRKLDDGPRYQHVAGADGQLHLEDLWLKTSDLANIARYNPDTDNVYHLFTRENPTVSQPMLMGNSALLDATNFDPNRRTAVVIHGWLGSVVATVNTVVVPAFLAAEDINVIVVDWSAGANTPYGTAVTNTPISGEAVARFINWLNLETGASLSSYHIVGHSLGGHQAGIVGRNLDGDAAYITSLDPALPGWTTNAQRFSSDDGEYTEVIHTNAGAAGFVDALGHVDFYPNGGTSMPGCDGDSCDHDRCFYYFAESLTSGGFAGIGCASLSEALNSNCTLDDTLNLGGLEPKTGQTGIFWMETNASPPFSLG